jgi:hypothetical protein
VIRLKAAWTVTAGVFPNKPIEQYTRRWELASGEWDKLDRVGRAALFHCLAAEAAAYAVSLQEPGKLNWVKLDWLWI